MDTRKQMLTDVVFVDTETTGLDPDRHEIWEVACIYWGKTYRRSDKPSERGIGFDTEEEHWGWLEKTWYLDVDLGQADSYALKLTSYHDRIKGRSISKPEYFARDFAALTRGKHLCGAVVSFDEERLRKLLRAHGACPEWHYHLIDVEALAVGYCAAKGIPFALPWDSDDLSRAVGVEPETHTHEALADALWAKRIWEAVTDA